MLSTWTSSLARCSERVACHGSLASALTYASASGQVMTVVMKPPRTLRGGLCPVGLGLYVLRHLTPSSRLGTLLPNPARAKEERRTRLLAPKARRLESVAPVQDEKASRHTSAPPGHALPPLLGRIFFSWISLPLDSQTAVHQNAGFPDISHPTISKSRFFRT